LLFFLGAIGATTLRTGWNTRFQHEGAAVEAQCVCFRMKGPGMLDGSVLTAGGSTMTFAGRAVFVDAARSARRFFTASIGICSKCVGEFGIGAPGLAMDEQ
jgi:hypothetical protein